MLGPQTRSRANVAAATEKAAGTDAKEVARSTSSKPLKPTCSKVLKKDQNAEGPGTLARFLALRERQKQGLPPPEIENVPEENLENIAEEETEPGIILKNVISTGLAVVCLDLTQIDENE